MLLRKASVGTWEEGCVTRECRPCFHHGTWRRASSRVLACVCIGIVSYLRCDVVNSIFQQEAAADLSSALFGCHIMHQRLASGIRPSHDHLCLLSRGRSLGLEAQVLLGHGDTPPRMSGRKLGSVVGSVVWTASRPENSAALGSLSRVQESPEPRWGEDGRRGGCRESGVAEPRPRPIVQRY